MFKLFIVFVLILFVVTQFILPIFFKRLQIMWLFKSKQEKPHDGTIEALKEEVSETASQLKETKQKVSTAEKDVEKMKSKLQ